MGEKLVFVWSRDQCSAKREKRLHFLVGLGFGIGLGLGYNLGHWIWIGSGFGSEIGAQGLQRQKVMSRDRSLAVASNLVKATTFMFAFNLPGAGTSGYSAASKRRET